MARPVFYLGDAIRVSEVLTRNGVAVDPDDVWFQRRGPDGEVTTIAATRASAGHYHADFYPDVPGRWWWRMWGSTDAPFADEDYVVIRRDRMVETI